MSDTTLVESGIKWVKLKYCHSPHNSKLNPCWLMTDPIFFMNNGMILSSDMIMSIVPQYNIKTPVCLNKY